MMGYATNNIKWVQYQSAKNKSYLDIDGSSFFFFTGIQLDMMKHNNQHYVWSFLPTNAIDTKFAIVIWTNQW